MDDARQPLATDTRAESVLFVSYRRVPWPFMTVLIVPAGATGPALAALREEAARLDPEQALSAARPLEEIRYERMNQPRLRSRIITLFGAAARFLTVVLAFSTRAVDAAVFGARAARRRHLLPQRRSRPEEPDAGIGWRQPRRLGEVLH